jgi:predicted transcriptional regulator
MPGSTFYFDPEGEGLSVFLGPTEARLMELAFQHGRLTVKSALFLLPPDSALAYTTVMTVLKRLSEKGLLDRRKTGRHFEYFPAVGKNEFLRIRIQAVQACLKRNFS